MQLPGSLALLKNRSILLTLFFGFSSGLPLSLSVTTLQAWFTASQIPVATIGWLTLLGMPYTYKFLWAPLLDRFSLPLFGRRRGWLYFTQAGLLVTIAALALLDPLQDLLSICVLALLISFISATQDIVVDAYRTEILQEHEQGVGSALFVMGYRTAMLISGGLALILADRFGWTSTFLFIACLMLIGIFTTFFAPEPKLTSKPAAQDNNFFSGLLEPVKDFWTRPHALMLISFVILYKLGEAFAVSLGSNFLMNGLGFTLTEVGAIYKTIGLIATLLGAYCGGILLNYIKLYRSLCFFGILQALGILLFAVLAAAGKNYPLMVCAIFAENFCAGMATCALMVFIMRLCNQQYTAAQYALLAAFSAIGRVFIGPVAGYLAAYYSWVVFFLVGFVMTIPGLLLLFLLRNRSIFADKHM